jgi:hypothetical protein
MLINWFVEFARDHPGDEPNYEQRELLLEKIHVSLQHALLASYNIDQSYFLTKAIPGCVDFGNQNLVAWFRRRKASKPIAKCEAVYIS